MKTARRKWMGIVRFVLPLFVMIMAALPSRAAPPSRTEVPLLFRQEKFNAAMLAEAVNHYVAIGEKETIHQLARLVSDPAKEHRGRIWLPERIDWVCRILFQSKNNKPIPRFLGGIYGPYSQSLNKKWPLYPVIHSGHSYFVLGETWIFPDTRYTEDAYFGLFRSLGNFRRVPIPVPTLSQALHDLKLLRRSRTWRTVEWREDYSQPIDKYMESRAWFFLKQQAQRIPEHKAVSAVRLEQGHGNRLPGRRESGPSG